MFWNLNQPPLQETFWSEHIILSLQHTNSTIPSHFISVHHFNVNCDLHIKALVSLSQLATNLQIFYLEYYLIFFQQNIFLKYTTFNHKLFSFMFLLCTCTYIRNQEHRHCVLYIPVILPCRPSG
jgi:hypothetical protein